MANIILPKTILDGRLELRSLAAATKRNVGRILLNERNGGFEFKVAALARTSIVITVEEDSASSQEGDIVIVTLTDTEISRTVAITLEKHHSFEQGRDSRVSGVIGINARRPMMDYKVHQPVSLRELGDMNDSQALVELAKIIEQSVVASTAVRAWIVGARTCLEGSELRSAVARGLEKRV